MKTSKLQRKSTSKIKFSVSVSSKRIRLYCTVLLITFCFSPVPVEGAEDMEVLSGPDHVSNTVVVETAHVQTTPSTGNTSNKSPEALIKKKNCAGCARL